MSDHPLPFPSRPSPPEPPDPVKLAECRAAVQAVGKECRAILRRYAAEVAYDAQDIVEPLPEGSLEDEANLQARQLTALIGQYLQVATWSRR